MKHFLISVGDFIASDLFSLLRSGASIRLPDVQQPSLPNVVWLSALLPVAVLAFLLWRQYRRIGGLKERNATLRRLSSDRLRLIRNLLDLGYVYNESPAIFLDKFRDRVHIRQFKSYELVERADDRLACLKEDERILVTLFEEGFTQRELCVVYGLKKISTLYVRYHRIRKKIDAADPPSGKVSGCKKNLYFQN